MMKKLLFFCAILLMVKISISQTTATNFNVPDCNGEMYNLFEDLDQGNVVVIAWVMPCVSCIGDPLEAFFITQDYDAEEVKFLMVDDYADSDCSEVQNWSENYQMGSCTKFSNSTISMSDYGVDGMPKIVVTGCKSHKIFFNKNSSHEGIKAAIDTAIEECKATYIIEVKDYNSKLSVFPNPASQEVYFSIESQAAPYTLSISNLLGVEVLKQEQQMGTPIDISFLSEGIYLTQIISNNTIYSKSFVVNR
jgi:hypothetical protein